MNLIPLLPVVAAVMSLLAAIALPWLVSPSRQRTLLTHFALVAAAWSLISALFWQQVPMLAGGYLALGVLLVWTGWKLMAAVCQVELRRRSVLWVGRLAVAGVLAVLLLPEHALVDVSPVLHWLPEWTAQAALLLVLCLLTLMLMELVLAIGFSQDRAVVAPWLGFWVVLCAGVLVDGLAGVVMSGLVVPPAGTAASLVAVYLAVLLTVQRTGPFPLQGEVPRAAFTQTRDAVLLVDGAQRVQMATPAACDLLGRSERQLMGVRLQKLLPHMPQQGDIWEHPLWLPDARRHDGGIWVQAADMHGRQEQAVARLLHLQGGNVRPSWDVHEPRQLALSRRWIQGVAVRPGLESVLRRYGMGRQFLAASIHVDYDWARVQQLYGDNIVDALIDSVVERLHQVCDWNVDCYRMPEGHFVLVMADLTGIEEVDKLVARAQELLGKPFQLAEKRWEMRMRVALVPDLRLYRNVDEWISDARDALQQSRGECVTTRLAAEHRNKLILALEKSLLNDGIDWWGEPLLNLTTQEIAGWRLQPRWTPEPGVCWAGDELMLAVAGLHMQRTLYGLAIGQPAQWPQPVWLKLPLEDVVAARKGLGAASRDLLLEVDRLCPEVLHHHGLRADPANLRLVVPAAGGDGFSSRLHPEVVRLDRALVMPGLAGDLSRQAMVRGCRGAARVREQRLYAAGVANHSDLTALRELGVDYVSGPAVGPRMALSEARRFRYRPLRD